MTSSQTRASGSSRVRQVRGGFLAEGGVGSASIRRALATDIPALAAASFWVWVFSKSMNSLAYATHPEIIKRLKRAHGHLAGIITMIEEGRPCVDLAQQLHAVDSAITNAKRELIHDHMEHCLGDGVQSGNITSKIALSEFKTLATYL
jgi:DNA-binding FrmR family transcriptional regulator